MGQPTCEQYWDGEPCLISHRKGNVLTFDAPDLDGAYQTLWISLTFSENIEADASKITYKNFVSGYFSWGYGHHNGSASSDGFVTSMPVPEPATWTMMVGGLALVGASLRHRKMSVSFG